MAEENLKIIKTEAQKLLEYLMVEAKIDVSEKEDVYEVQIETEDTGILIGYHGETLTSLQLILSLILYKRLGSWLRVVINVGDWRQKREEILKQMALSAAERVAATGEAMVLPNLSSFERRIIHLLLVDHPNVTSSSEGEGEERKLIIKPKE